MSINSVAISGNLTRDGELKSTANGTGVLTLSVAVNERRKNQAGEWEDFPNYVECTLFGRRADSLAQYLTKGTKVSIQGHLRWHQWEYEGQKRTKLSVVVDEIEFMSPRQQQQTQVVSAVYSNEEIPF